MTVHRHASNNASRAIDNRSAGCVKSAIARWTKCAFMTHRAAQPVIPPNLYLANGYVYEHYSRGSGGLTGDTRKIFVDESNSAHVTS